MKFNDYLPIGSIVQLKNAKRKLMITGICQLQVKEEKLYDYIGVIYPEGSVSVESSVLFNHSEIESMIFRGYEDEQREGYINLMQATIDIAKDIIYEESIKSRERQGE